MRRVLPFAVLLAACTAAPQQEAPGTPSAAATTTTTAAPTAAEAAPRRVRSATLPADALARLGVTEPGVDSTAHLRRLPLPCAEFSTSGRDLFGYHVNFDRQWKNSRFRFTHLVTWYQDRTGADAVAKTREMAESCREYVYPTKEAGDQKLRVTAPVDMRTPEGVSAGYAYCEDNGTTHACWGLIAHGDMMSVLIVFSADRVRSLGMVAEMLPATAELLARA